MSKSEDWIPATSTLLNINMLKTDLRMSYCVGGRVLRGAITVNNHAGKVRSLAQSLSKVMSSDFITARGFVERRCSKM